MKLRLKTASLAALLTGASWCTFAQVAEPSGPVGMHPPMVRMDPAKRQAAMQKRAEELKAQLKLEPAQDGAWTTFIEALKVPDDRVARRPDREEYARLTTPERLERMRAMRTQHIALMDQREAATRMFYAGLMPEQKIVFDTATLLHLDHRGRREGKAQPHQPRS